MYIRSMICSMRKNTVGKDERKNLLVLEAECKDHVVAERVKTLGPARTGLLDTRPR